MRNSKPSPNKRPVGRPKKEDAVTAMSPAMMKREMEALSWAYEHTAISSVAYDKAKARLVRSLEVWSAKNVR